MTRDYSETKMARAYVARCAAAILNRDTENEWIEQDEDDPSVTVPEPTQRRRRKALDRLIASLMKAGGR